MKGLALMLLQDVLTKAVAYAKDYIQKNWRWGEKRIDLVEDVKSEEPGRDAAQ